MIGGVDKRVKERYSFLSQSQPTKFIQKVIYRPSARKQIGRKVGTIAAVSGNTKQRRAFANIEIYPLQSH